MDKPRYTLNENQRELLIQILARAFQEIRRLAWEGRSKQDGDLADAFHHKQYDFAFVNTVTKEFKFRVSLNFCNAELPSSNLQGNHRTYLNHTQSQV